MVCPLGHQGYALWFTHDSHPTGPGVCSWGQGDPKESSDKSSHHSSNLYIHPTQILFK
jgi:hypothetical protein